MANLSIQLDPVALREATSQAIMGILTPEVRENILRSSISSLLSPSTNSWERGQSPIELAFARAIESVANELTKEYVKNSPDVVAKLKDLIEQTARKLLESDIDKMAERMADAFVNSIRSDR